MLLDKQHPCRSWCLHVLDKDCCFWVAAQRGRVGSLNTEDLIPSHFAEGEYSPGEMCLPARVVLEAKKDPWWETLVSVKAPCYYDPHVLQGPGSFWEGRKGQQSHPCNLMVSTSPLQAHLWVPVLLSSVSAGLTITLIFQAFLYFSALAWTQSRGRWMLDFIRDILHGPTNPTSWPCEISQSVVISQCDRERKTTHAFWGNFSVPTLSWGSQGPQKQKVKRPCCSYKGILKTQKLIGVWASERGRCSLR